MAVETIFNKYAVNQLGVVVEDVEKASELYSKLYGVGPFVIVDVARGMVKYYGADTPVQTRCAYAQYGDLQIELIELVSEEPSVYSDLGRYGLHHLCVWVDDVDAAVAHMADMGYQVAMEMNNGGMRIVYVDTVADLGYYVEFHNPMPALHDLGKQLREGWDGQTAYLNMADLM